ncbi:hypothetical protein TRIUR3_23958 [Triticum urartu]|uniref:Uncharacterized protein n=1 Tax=Triticum urartu TaxID=4572 RepID=M8AQ20_TRIUA|nr:hypothetical protein TRIUR3_23958 [Triticum urartu]
MGHRASNPFFKLLGERDGRAPKYTNGRAVFGVVGTDSPLYAPILGFFAVTGIPTSGYLWYKAVQTANKDAEEQDRRDGFL